MKTSELTGAALDWAVAKCEGWNVSVDEFLKSQMSSSKFAYSSVWAKGGPIIERERIDLRFDRSGRSTYPWNASTLERMLGGPTPLIAAMRGFVASKLGDKVEIPEELT